MDQVKVFLRLLKKHHFWVLVSIAALVGFMCWWSGANALATATQANEGIVKKSYGDLDRVDKVPHPANQQFADGVNAKNEELKAKVLEEWKQAYEAQRKTFSWPPLVADDINKLRPDEQIPDIVRSRCRANEVFVEALKDKVFATADYRHLKPNADPDAVAAAAPKMRPAAQQPGAKPPEPIEDTMEGLVVWSKAHREALEQRYTLNRQPGTPSDLNIRLAQEDIWLLENLAKVIRKTNEGAADVIAVPIKRIDSLDIAQWAVNDAVRESPKVYVDKTGGGEGGGGGLAGGGGGLAGGGGGEQTPPSEDPAERAKQLDDELLNGRYLSDTGAPLGPGETPYGEFKLMFVRLKLVIDQQKIPELLVNCANADLPIEVVRLTMDEPMVQPTSKADAGPAAGRGGGGGLAGAAGQRGGPTPAGNRPQANVAGGDEIEATPADVPVEVCGLVQIFNAPDPEKLGTGSAADPSKRPTGVPAATVKAPRGGNGVGGGGLHGR
jgi:hypothetical protein